MIGREPPELAAARWEQLGMLQSHYPLFVPFCEDMMVELGFGLTEIQADIAEYMQNGPDSLMVQAQRSQAKTTIAAIFAVWCLIHSPAHRVLIISAGSTQANEISILIIRLIMSVDVLECMRPDKQAGDRTSTEAFDVHHSLKGLDKSPSVACIGINSNLQGKRADLLIADDVESAKNSMTAVMRAVLLQFTRDFASIVQSGRTLWLGTPQSIDSVYNTLPARGVTVRIWPGRYPTPEQAKHYSGMLSPLLVARMAANPGLQSGGGIMKDQGQAVDPELLDDNQLIEKELNQGTPYFQLQHMLNTALTDSMRHPLRNEHMTVYTPATVFPLAPVRGMTQEHRAPFVSCGFPFKLATMQEVGKDFEKLQKKWAYIDPAAGGANGDETAYAIGGFLNSNIYLMSAGGIPGGYDLTKLELLADILCRHQLDGITIEKNMGYGAFQEVFTPILRKRMICQIDDDLVSGQKELRLINTLAPVMGRGALFISESVIAEDEERCSLYAAHLRQTYSLFFQIAKLTRDRDALVHDDRLDALEGLVRVFQAAVSLDQTKAVAAMRKREHEAIMKNPLMYELRAKSGPVRKNASMLRRHRK